MKKFIAVISILALLFCLVSGFAEGIDLKSLTDDELTNLSDLIREEMFSRGIIFEVTFPAGKYIVGKDILAGDYDIIVQGVQHSAGPVIQIYETQEDYDNYHSEFYEWVRADGRVHVSLKDDTILTVESRSGSISITNAANPFAP